MDYYQILGVGRDASPDDIPNALHNWEALAPEERWWLYTMTVATTGQAMQKGIGWRKALRAQKRQASAPASSQRCTATPKASSPSLARCRTVSAISCSACAQPLAVSAWPGCPFSIAIGGCSRSATIDIIRHDGKPVTG